MSLTFFKFFALLLLLATNVPTHASKEDEADCLAQIRLSILARSNEVFPVKEFIVRIRACEESSEEKYTFISFPYGAESCIAYLQNINSAYGPFIETWNYYYRDWKTNFEARVTTLRLDDLVPLINDGQCAATFKINFKKSFKPCFSDLKL